MKNFNYIILSITISLVSCNSNVYFEKPQPSFKKDLNKIPHKFQGVWKNKESSFYYLKITKDSIVEGINVDINLPYPLPPEIKNLKVIEDTLIIKNLGLNIKAEINNNRVKAQATEKEAICINDISIKIRRYKNYLFINSESPNNLWTVSLFYIDKNGNLRKVTSYKKEELDKLTELIDINITKNEIGSKKYILNPSKSEFKNILKFDIFNNEMIFEKSKDGQ